MPVINASSGVTQKQLNKVEQDSKDRDENIQDQIDTIDEWEATYEANYNTLVQNVETEKTAIRSYADSGDADTLASAKNYADHKISEAVSSAYKVKGTKTNYSDLPATGNVAGDVWNVTNAKGTIGTADYTPPGTNYVWTGSAWDPLGGTVDLRNYDTKAGVNTKITNNNTNVINPVLQQHQNLIKVFGVTVAANSTAAADAGVTIAVTNLPYASTDRYVYIVSPVPASITDSVTFGLRCTGVPQAGKITFKADTTPTAAVNYTITVIDTNAGVTIS